MFFEEGGRIQDEVFDKQLSELEQFAVAEKHGLLLSEWQAVRQTMRQMLDQGVVNDMRAKLLADQGY